MYEKLGDTIAHECVIESLERITSCISKNNGKIVKYIGDEAMAYFLMPIDAFNCACDIHNHFSIHTTSHGHPIKIRIGFCGGPVVLDNGNPFGDTVNVAARVTALARAEKTITTSDTAQALPDWCQEQCRPFKNVRLKGKSKPIKTLEIIWDFEDATSIMIPAKINKVQEYRTELGLTFQGQNFIVSEKNSPFLLGRGEDNHIVLAAWNVSRSHSRIEYRHGDLVYIDHSTNGSYINLDAGNSNAQEPDIFLHHREMVLSGTGTGVISLGKPISEDIPSLISFITRK